MGAAGSGHEQTRHRKKAHWEEGERKGGREGGREELDNYLYMIAKVQIHTPSPQHSTKIPHLKIDM